MEKMTMDDMIKMGLGAMLVAKDKTENFINDGIQKGIISKEQGERFLQSIKEQSKNKTAEIEQKIEKEIHNQLKSLGVATKEDINSLKEEIISLKEEINNKKC